MVKDDVQDLKEMVRKLTRDCEIMKQFRDKAEDEKRQLRRRLNELLKDHKRFLDKFYGEM